MLGEEVAEENRKGAEENREEGDNETSDISLLSAPSAFPMC